MRKELEKERLQSKQGKRRMDSMRDHDRYLKTLDCLDALEPKAKAACSPSSTYNDDLRRWHRDNILF